MDVETRTRLKVGFQQSRIVQDYQTLASIASQIFGGNKQQTPSHVPSDAMRPQTVDELKHAFNQVLGDGF
ncbi:MAG TPA: hypothetical protein PLD10_18545 [Rhodopila sp.]|nr:hypothetical protein [Rhodopila sp.]